MRILQLHCDKIEYTPIKKEISVAEDVEPTTVELDEVVVCFVAIEKGDDEHVVQNSVSQIKESMEKIGSKKLGLPVILYLKNENYLSPKIVSKLVKKNIICGIKYAIVRKNPSEEGNE